MARRVGDVLLRDGSDRGSRVSAHGVRRCSAALQCARTKLKLGRTSTEQAVNFATDQGSQDLDVARDEAWDARTCAARSFDECRVAAEDSTTLACRQYRLLTEVATPEMIVFVGEVVEWG